MSHEDSNQLHEIVQKACKNIHAFRSDMDSLTKERQLKRIKRMVERIEGKNKEKAEVIELKSFNRPKTIYKSKIVFKPVNSQGNPMVSLNKARFLILNNLSAGFPKTSKTLKELSKAVDNDIILLTRDGLIRSFVSYDGQTFFLITAVGKEILSDSVERFI
jgi:hypothetical protein